MPFFTPFLFDFLTLLTNIILVSEEPSILIIEDDATVGPVLKIRLQSNGYRAEVADDGSVGYEKARTGAFDLIILDVMLPGMNGFDILRKLREENVRSKILMLTAKSEFDARVEGLEAGADDYLAKPFDYREVLLRLRNLLAAGALAETVTVGDVSLDKVRRTVERGGVQEILTDREFEVLLYLMEHAGEVIPKETLLKRVWKTDFERDPNVVNVYLSYVRKKLERLGLPQPIETVHGAGIRMVKP